MFRRHTESVNVRVRPIYAKSERSKSENFASGIHDGLLVFFVGSTGCLDPLDDDLLQLGEDLLLFLLLCWRLELVEVFVEHLDDLLRLDVIFVR